MTPAIDHPAGVEVSTSLVLAWRLAQERRGGCKLDVDQRAVRWIAVCFAVLAIYVSYEAISQLADRRPQMSAWSGSCWPPRPWS